jgi:hypothetical protein
MTWEPTVGSPEPTPYFPKLARTAQWERRAIGVIVQKIPGV